MDYSKTISANTPEFCKSLCAEKGFAYAGVENSFECYCGNDEPKDEYKKDQSECNKPCTGDKSLKCGGVWRINVYKTEGIYEKI